MIALACWDAWTITRDVCYFEEEKIKKTLFSVYFKQKYGIYRLS